MSSHHFWDLPTQSADRPPQYSTLPNLNTAKNNHIHSRNTCADKPQSLLARMDPSYDFRYDETVWVEPYIQHATPIDQQAHQTSERSQPADVSASPTRWSDPSRPREFGAFMRSNPHITSVQRTQSTGPVIRREVPVSRLAASRPKRRPRPLDQERLREPSNSAMLYPQMSPYSQHDDDLTHATFDYCPRSVSQPVTPGLINTETAAYDAPATVFATPEPLVDSTNDDTGFSTNDAAFTDEHEFRLFVEATAGLGPIPSMDDHHFASEFARSQPADIRTPRRAGTDPIVSPIAETPNTIHALQHLAQMPQSTPPPQIERPHLQSFGSNFEDWLQPPPLRPRLTQQHSMPQMSANALLNSWRDVPDTTPIDDELPDYAASQAQAQAAQRVEATRRAQELQRRWQESGSHVMRYG